MGRRVRGRQRRSKRAAARGRRGYAWTCSPDFSPNTDERPAAVYGSPGSVTRAMNILVTGITGRIGANLAASLVAEGHQVRGLVWARDARVEKLEGLGVELLYGSLTEAADVTRAVDGM